jgi:predicted nucleotidyltransferase
VLALLRLGRPRATLPLRWLSVTYIDLFRAIPGIMLVYMVGFGFPWSQTAGARSLGLSQGKTMRCVVLPQVLRQALLPLAHVNAAWLGGSDAFGRYDELSDVDLQVEVDDGHVAATFGAVEAALAAASPIVARLVMPLPTWHGHAPARHDFGTRYTADDLPAGVQQTLRELSFVADLDDLAANLPTGERLLVQLVAELDQELGR